MKRARAIDVDADLEVGCSEKRSASRTSGLVTDLSYLPYGIHLEVQYLAIYPRHTAHLR